MLTKDYRSDSQNRASLTVSDGRKSVACEPTWVLYIADFGSLGAPTNQWL